MRSLLLLRLGILLVVATACLVPHAAESTSTHPLSDGDEHMCFESLLTLGACKHDLLATSFPQRRVPAACCRAADEVGNHCGSLTRTFFRSVLPRDLFKRCARHAPSLWRAPPRAPPLPTATPSVYGGGARPPPAPEAQTSAPPTPSVPDTTSGGTHAAPTHAIVRPPPLPKVSVTVPRPVAGSTSAPPPYPVTGPRGSYTPAPPKVGNGTYAPVVSGSPRVVGASCDSTVPVNEETPKPKVISGGSTGVRTRRAPGVYVPAKGAHGVYGSATGTPGVYSPAESAPMAASSKPPNGAQTRTRYT